MLNKMFGTKGKMTEAYLGDRRVVVTKIQIPQLTVTQVKDEDKDGYNAIQVAFGAPRKHVSKSLKNHFKGLKEVPRNAREVKEIKQDSQLNVGDILGVSDLVKLGDILSIQGTTKGKGFAGVIKRWGFARGPRTHGQSDRTRAPGSIGQGTTPGRVHRGKKMGGHLGTTKHTVKNSQIIHIDLDSNEIWVTGHVSGNQSGLLSLTITDHKDLEVKDVYSTYIKTAKPKSEEITEESQEKPEEGNSDAKEPQNNSAATDQDEEKKQVKPNTEKSPKDETNKKEDK